MSYTIEMLRKMSVERIWIELGLHRGVLDKTERIYYLGVPDCVGVLSRNSREVFEADILRPGPWRALLKDSKPEQPWRGPVLGDTCPSDIAKHFARRIQPLLEALNSGTRPKPRIRVRTHIGAIAYEDMPDTGIEPSPVKSRLMLRRRN